MLLSGKIRHLHDDLLGILTPCFRVSTNLTPLQSKPKFNRSEFLLNVFKRSVAPTDVTSTLKINIHKKNKDLILHFFTFEFSRFALLTSVRITLI